MRAEFPNLNIRCNSTDPIGTELDFYFPELRMAIELNGILHYEPIYGQEKLERIQKNDLKKAAQCLKEGIRLFAIDVSDKAYFTQRRKEGYWQMIKELVASTSLKSLSA